MGLINLSLLFSEMIKYDLIADDVNKITIVMAMFMSFIFEASS